eukprot:CAMPEP_0113305200 /NCGR_PEP_ID=MMETSP0010_2-20120614/4909_1 /TAXON_ID=216773 ORGANISM="Corethron hystrix, Strain 308" /NCGR_SAMPLE_ID=MMETSP0010_2 /ASSEMBLY_ACC=CAM_ASM_000155 /LENGTH=215 /DNA_ID=CAMNT_0000159545 /DNA_START=196 /DNA_END=843 /DNA_ORIENTATION=- /assembly_acc=CAM_ASM_000155
MDKTVSVPLLPGIGGIGGIKKNKKALSVRNTALKDNKKWSSQMNTSSHSVHVEGTKRGNKSNKLGILPVKQAQKNSKKSKGSVSRAGPSQRSMLTEPLNSKVILDPAAVKRNKVRNADSDNNEQKTFTWQNGAYPRENTPKESPKEILSREAPPIKENSLKDNTSKQIGSDRKKSIFVRGVYGEASSRRCNTTVPVQFFRQMKRESSIKSRLSEF